MPISLSAKRSLRKAIKNHKDNSSFKSKLKKLVKEFLAKPSTEGLGKVSSILDKANKKNLYHKNKIARLKSKYAHKIGKEVEKKIVKKAAKKGTIKKAVKSSKKM